MVKLSTPQCGVEMAGAPSGKSVCSTESKLYGGSKTLRLVSLFVWTLSVSEKLYAYLNVVRIIQCSHSGQKIFKL